MALTQAQQLAVRKTVAHVIETLGLRLAGNDSLTQLVETRYLVGDGSAQFPATASGKIAVLIELSEAAIAQLDERGVTEAPQDGAPLS